jgi:hypothetical protein
MRYLRLLGAGTALLLLGVCSLAPAAENQTSTTSGQGVQITQLTNRLRVEINGQLFTEYFFKDVTRPYCYPLIGPGGLALTRNWPMKDVPGEEHDHPHHRSFWYAHIEVNGKDFWDEQRVFGKIVHEGFDEIKSGKDFGIIKARDKWVAADGTVVFTDQRTMRIYAPASPNERMFDFEITLHALNEDLTFGDNKDGTMAVRLAETMRLKDKDKKPGQGHIVNSAGDRDDQTWGKRADWCDYYGPVDGKTVGVAIFDNPENPRHPTWWHVRDYGLFAANPFGQHDFEKLKDKTAGNLTVPAGKSITFRYRFYLHEGDQQQAKVAEKYKAYVKEIH